MLSFFKGKGLALNCSNYRRLKLTDQLMKVKERVPDSHICKMVNIDEMQHSFMPGRGTTDTIFIAHQLQEKYIPSLPSSTWRRPLTVCQGRFCGGCFGALVLTVYIIQGMYSNGQSCVLVNGQLTEEFDVDVGIHQGFVLSPLLFIFVLEAEVNAHANKTLSLVHVCLYYNKIIIYL